MTSYTSTAQERFLAFSEKYASKSTDSLDDADEEDNVDQSGKGIALQAPDASVCLDEALLTSEDLTPALIRIYHCYSMIAFVYEAKVRLYSSALLISPITMCSPCGIR